MNVSELIFNIRENYKADEGDRLEKIYRKEFESYPPTKLDQVWEVIKENHSYAKFPELGNIFKYMALLGIARTKDAGTFYHRCTQLIESKDQYNNVEKDADGDIIYIECNTKYSTKSKFCPKCNMDKKISKPLVNTLEVVKCNSLPNDLRVLNELCAACSKYQKSSLVKGSKCSAWGTHDEYKKSGRKCEDCCCRECCNEKPLNFCERETIKIKRV